MPALGQEKVVQTIPMIQKIQSTLQQASKVFDIEIPT